MIPVKDHVDSPAQESHGVESLVGVQHMSGRGLWLVTGSLRGGGAERQIAQMANYWAAMGLSITVATWSGPEVRDFYLLDHRVRRIHMNVAPAGRAPFARVWFNLRRVVRLRGLLAAARPAAVLSFITESNVLTILAGVRLDLRVVVSERIQPAKDPTVPMVWCGPGSGRAGGGRRGNRSAAR